MESLIDYGFSGMDNGTKFNHFLQGIKNNKLKAGVNVVWAQPEKYGTNFDATISYLDQKVMKKGLYTICPYCIDQKSASKTLSGSLYGESRM